MKSSSKRPTSFSANAVHTAVLKPKQRRSPRAPLYSPPPSQPLNSRAVRIRPSPGSRRSIISPSATMSQRHEPAGLILSVAIVLVFRFQEYLRTVFTRFSPRIDSLRQDSGKVGKNQYPEFVILHSA